MSGLDEARATAEKLRTDVEKKAENENVAMQEAKAALDVVRSNPALSKMYNDNAKVGAENLGASLPMLKVHATGKSSTNELPNGQEPEDGYFFYVPKQVQFKDVDCHILTISRGYRAEGVEVDKSTGKKKIVFNQLIGGVIRNDDLMYPFIMYMSGTTLQRMWDFGKAAGKFTRAKPVSIPLFAMHVRMTTEKIVTSFGKNWVINFEILKDDTGALKLVTDEGEFEFLRNTVDVVNDMIEQIIEAKAVEPVEPVKIKATEPERDPITVEDANAPKTPKAGTEDVNPDDLPF